MRLIDLEWNLDSLAEWWIDSQNFLQDEELNMEGNKLLSNESLAQALNRLRNREFTDQEDDAHFAWAQAIYEFYKHHSLRLAFSGTEIPDIIIGCVNDQGEISLSDKRVEWAYRFDMADFLTTTRRNLIKFLTEWAGKSQNEVAQKRVYELIKQLDMEKLE